MQAETQNRQNDTEAQPVQQLLNWGEWWEHFQDLPEPAEDEIFLHLRAS
jgi:neutral trehalase